MWTSGRHRVSLHNSEMSVHEVSERLVKLVNTILLENTCSQDKQKEVLGKIHVKIASKTGHTETLGCRIVYEKATAGTDKKEIRWQLIESWLSRVIKGFCNALGADWEFCWKMFTAFICLFLSGPTQFVRRCDGWVHVFFPNVYRIAQFSRCGSKKCSTSEVKCLICTLEWQLQFKYYSVKWLLKIVLKCSTSVYLLVFYTAAFGLYRVNQGFIQNTV